MAIKALARGDTGGVARPDLHFLGHSTVRVELAGRTVLTDPLLADTVGALRRVLPLPDPATWAGVDLVLISHLHGDHLHIPSLRTVGPHVRTSCRPGRR
jgi:L-ascorbate metabolism protein UlaG (beta-lactamase superfamily)